MILEQHYENMKPEAKTRFLFHSFGISHHDSRHQIG